MDERTRSLTFSAVMCALGCTLLLVASAMPTTRLALLCLSSLGAVGAALRSGRNWGWGVYAVTAILSLLLSPAKAVALCYACFAGWYPLVKLPLERWGSAAARWTVKLVLFNAAFALLLVFGGAVLGTAVSERPQWMLWLGGNGAFLVFDLAVNEAILLYMRKIAGRV